ncbi:LysR family transcriptional regulator [Methylobacter psychrophilus]|uniref:LysR family transcriptional regulator n=1 Tax=Methylobacter psychrophilus TaxID=96941 RepID=UPI0021D50D31|nr:LysR family transcriptional regulator [Methylobacter psychrophilus]
MEIQQIRYFLAVCDHGTITHAAQLSYVSQPSLTQAIKKLEDEIGGALFTRTRSGCQLTPLGRMVEPNFRQIYKDLQATKAEAIRFTRLNTIPLRIGLMKTIGSQRLSPCLAGYQQDFPNIELELIVDSEVALLKQLDLELLDIVISAPIHTLAAPYQSTVLYEERYVVAFSATHRFNQLQKIDLKALQSEPYLDRLNCELREGLKAVCHNQDVDLYAAYRSNSEEWILRMVEEGIGVALMPEYTLPKEATDISYRYLVEPAISRQVYAIYTQQISVKPELPGLISHLSLA